MGWKDAGKGVIFNFKKKGDKLVGTLLSKGSYITQWGNPRGIYKIRTGNDTVTVFGSTVLDRTMDEIPVNANVQIIYNGKIKNPKTNQSKHDFNVKYDDSKTGTEKAPF